MRNKEQAILEAAEREFIAKGFAGARTTSIAEAAGVTHAMLHYYFRTKEQLFERILDEKMRLMGESVLAAFGQPGLPLAERLRDGIERHFDFIMANPDMPRFIVNEVFSRPERYETMQARIREIAGVLMCDIQRELDYPGRIVWIASESEFTPKTIQTRNSRAGLVYAAKIAVENDGRLKIGLYGEVKL